MSNWDVEIAAEGGQPNGSGELEPTWYREWFTEDRETHHRLQVTLYGPWIEGPSKDAELPKLEDLLAYFKETEDV